MRKTSRLKLLPIFTILAAAAVGLPAHAESGLTWKMAFMLWDGAAYQSLPFSKTLELKDNDEFQIFIQADSQCYCYVIDEDPNAAASTLLRSTLKPGTPLYLPGEDGCYSVIPSPKGTERIHAIVSLDRRQTLEKLLTALESAKGDRVEESRAVLDEIARIKQSLSSLAEAPEKPVPMGGVSRGPKSPKAIEYAGRKTYVKTIRFTN